MSYTPHIQVLYRLAADGELRDGRTVDIDDRPGGRAAVLLDRHECSGRVPREMTQVASHQTVSGGWRQRWTHDGRMRRTAEGLGLALSRLELVPGHMMPKGRVAMVTETKGSCVWLVDEDECTKRLQNDMNDLLLRAAGDGLWIQVWFGHHPRLSVPGPGRLVTPPAAPLILA
jgi:hypothetical protein